MAKATEVEIRLLLKNKQAIIDQLEELDAQVVYFSKLKDYWYCPKNVKRYQDAIMDKTGFA